jgi:hypothetical protein
MKSQLPAKLVFIFVSTTGVLLSSPPDSVCDYKKTSLHWLASAISYSAALISMALFLPQPSFSLASRQTQLLIQTPSNL